MKTYHIRSTHYITENDYNKGAIGYINEYDLNEIIHAHTPKEAVNNYIDKVLGKNSSFDDFEISEDKTHLWRDFMEDAEGFHPTENDIKLWKKGRTSLFNNYTTLHISELVPVKWD